MQLALTTALLASQACCIAMAVNGDATCSGATCSQPVQLAPHSETALLQAKQTVSTKQQFKVLEPAPNPGEECTTDDECISSQPSNTSHCLGGRCCNPWVPLTNCESCNEGGRCGACAPGTTWVSGHGCTTTTTTQPEPEQQSSSTPSSTSWRLLCQEPDEAGGWDVPEVQFYSDYGCTQPVPAGTPFASNFSGDPVYEASSAFDGDTSTKWGGRPDESRRMWIGQTWAEDISPRCVKVLQTAHLRAPKIILERRVAAGAWSFNDTCKDTPGWKDNDGYTCFQYNSCKDVLKWANSEGVSAADACCKCGGGTKPLNVTDWVIEESVAPGYTILKLPGGPEQPATEGGHVLLREGGCAAGTDIPDTFVMKDMTIDDCSGRCRSMNAEYFSFGAGFFPGVMGCTCGANAEACLSKDPAANSDGYTTYRLNY